MNELENIPEAFLYQLLHLDEFGATEELKGLTCCFQNVTAIHLELCLEFFFVLGEGLDVVLFSSRTILILLYYIHQVLNIFAKPFLLSLVHSFKVVNYSDHELF